MIERSLLRRSGPALALSLGLTALPFPAATATRSDAWCRDGDHDRPTHCEVREFTVPAGQPIEVDAAPNGGIDVEGGSGGQVRVQAKVVAQGYSEEEARQIASQVRIETSGTIRAEGPPTRSRRSWHVSYRLTVPEGAQLSLRTVNGGVHVDRASGHVTGRTQNGGLHVQLEGTAWEGEGLDLETSNGGVHLLVPEGYNAELETGTVNGGLDLDFPVTVQGRVKKRINVTLGRGGAPIRAVTTNGGISLRRP
jgi:hypothetical protein